MCNPIDFILNRKKNGRCELESCISVFLSKYYWEMRYENMELID